MNRKLTVKQRQALTKWVCMTVSVLLILGAFASIPYIVAALPKMSGKTAQILLPDRTVEKEKHYFTLGAGWFAPQINENEGDDTSADSDISIPEPDIPEPDEDDLPVFSSNLSWYEDADDAALNIINFTRFKIDLNDYLKREFPINADTDGSGPLVLIIHTHGSESYLKNGYDFYSPDETFRSLEEEQTVVHIGEVLCDELNSLGINTVHDKTMYDLTEFNKSYNYSREGILKALEEYPTVRFVIDLHRDSIFDANGNNIKPLTEINGEKCAQLMLVVGTDQDGAVHPNWRDNLTFATHLQNELNSMFPTLARPLNLRTAAFNQALTKGSIILEVGACGNTISEAENAVKLFAKAYEKIIKYNSA